MAHPPKNHNIPKNTNLEEILHTTPKRKKQNMHLFLQVRTNWCATGKVLFYPDNTQDSNQWTIRQPVNLLPPEDNCAHFLAYTTQHRIEGQEPFQWTVSNVEAMELEWWDIRPRYPTPLVRFRACSLGKEFPPSFLYAALLRVLEPCGWQFRLCKPSR